MARLFTLHPAGGGTPRILNDRESGFRVLKGITGLNAPPFVLLTSDTPLLDGEQLNDVYAAPRTIVLPMLIAGRTEAEFRERARGLIRDVFPLRGEATLEVAQPDGQRRRVPVMYVDGLEGSEAIDDGGFRWWRTGIRLTALSPWWLGDPYEQQWAYAEPVNFLPITPRRVSSSSILGDVTLTNPGDVETYPEWSLTAPATGVTLTRLDTGESLHVDAPVPAGRTLRIVTAPRETQLALDDGTPMWSALGNGSSFWPLPVGEAPLSLQVAGAGVGTELVLSYTPRYATVL